MEEFIDNEAGMLLQEFIAVHALGRSLKPGETIQFANGNILDNRRENLLVCVGSKKTPLNEVAAAEAA